MKNSVYMCAVAVALIAAVPRPASAERVIPPPVPTDVRAPEGTRAFLVGHAIGTQNYICLPSGTGFAWTLFGPQATLFNGADRQIMTHFLSANPDEAGVLRATWQHSDDTSAVWAMATGTSSDPAYVAPGAIPWLRLHVVGKDTGTHGGRRLTSVTDIQRLNTVGGIAPSTGCAQASDVGKKNFVPYTADYFFYKDARRHDDDEDAD